MRLRAADRVAAGAGPVQEELLAAPRRRRHGRARRSRLVGEPRAEPRLRLREQVDHRPVVFEVRAARGTQHGTAAGREHDVGHLREVLNDRLFAIAKSGLAFDLEDRRDRHAEPSLELVIGVDKSLRKSPCELAPERRFAGPHEADQK